MDLLEKRLKWDVKALASEPAMYYGKIALLAVGAFFIGRASK